MTRQAVLHQEEGESLTHFHERERVLMNTQLTRALDLVGATYGHGTMTTREWHDKARALLKECGYL